MPAGTPELAELLERAPALLALTQRLEAARSRGGVVLVAGEAGIGKSSLLRAAAATHGVVWWGCCDALATPHPLAPLLDIARDVQPRFAGRLTGPRPALFDAVLDELRAAASPVLVVVEDAHWADDATLDLLKFLGRRIEGTHAVLAISFRDDEVTASHPLRLLLGELPPAAVTRVDLQRLSEQAVEALARQARRPTEGVYTATRGNPFFVTEVLREADATVPRSVQDLVLARYARLSSAAQAILRVAALVPARIERWLLDAMLSPGAGDLEACLHSGLLQAEGSHLHYRHELARAAIESSLQSPVAQGLHRQLLRTLENSGQPIPVARLAHHAGMADDTDAVRRFAPAAAEEAASRDSHREAARHWQAALRCLPTTGDTALRLAWLEAYAQECHLLDRFDAALEARQQMDEQLERAGDVSRRALNLSHTALLHVHMTHNALADAASRRAIELLESLPPGRELATAYGVEGSLRMLNREYESSVSWCRRAVELAERFGDRARELSSRATAAVATMFIDYDAGCSDMEAVLALARAERRHAVASNVLLNLGSGSGELMQLSAAERWLHEGIAFAVEHEMDGTVHYARAWLALCELRRGRWDEAAEHAGFVVDRTGATSISRLMALAALGRLRGLRGDPGAGATLDEALALAGSSGTLQRLAPVSAARAEAAWLRGDLAACDAEARTALALAQQRRHPWFIGELAVWCWRAGTLHEVPEHCAEPYALEVAGRWREAAAAWQRLGCPLEQARALAGGDAQAQQEALATLERIGARPEAEGLRRRLREAGVRGVARGARTSTRGHPCGLTSAEMRVLALMSEDLRNASIAERLHRSVRTVDHHVAAVLAKLEVSTRLEAVRRAEREGWLAPLSQSRQSGQSGPPR
jgi:DNA-binding CsgD family transcriptional regulator/tetratricopeptide (TPR) repeat protein